MRIHLALLPLALSSVIAFSQDANLVPDDLAYTQRVMSTHHFVAQAVWQMEATRTIRFQYDHYPEPQSVERLKIEEDGVYARKKDKEWLKSEDWGETGTPVDKDKARDLDYLASFIQVPFGNGTHKDSSQGETVWKPISQDTKEGVSHFTYERTREHPLSDGTYPHYTFCRYQDESDGQLWLSSFSGRFRSATTNESMPVTIQYTFLISFPNAKVVIAPPPKPNP